MFNNISFRAENSINTTMQRQTANNVLNVVNRTIQATQNNSSGQINNPEATSAGQILTPEPNIQEASKTTAQNTIKQKAYSPVQGSNNGVKTNSIAANKDKFQGTNIEPLSLKQDVFETTSNTQNDDVITIAGKKIKKKTAIITGLGILFSVIIAVIAIKNGRKKPLLKSSPLDNCTKNQQPEIKEPKQTRKTDTKQNISQVQNPNPEQTRTAPSSNTRPNPETAQKQSVSKQQTESKSSEENHENKQIDKPKVKEKEKQPQDKELIITLVDDKRPIEQISTPKVKEQEKTEKPGQKSKEEILSTKSTSPALYDTEGADDTGISTAKEQNNKTGNLAAQNNPESLVPDTQEGYKVPDYEYESKDFSLYLTEELLKTKRQISEKKDKEWAKKIPETIFSQMSAGLGKIEKGAVPEHLYDIVQNTLKELALNAEYAHRDALKLQEEGQKLALKAQERFDKLFEDVTTIFADIQNHGANNFTAVKISDITTEDFYDKNIPAKLMQEFDPSGKILKRESLIIKSPDSKDYIPITIKEYGQNQDSLDIFEMDKYNKKLITYLEEAKDIAAGKIHADKRLCFGLDGIIDYSKDITLDQINSFKNTALKNVGCNCYAQKATGPITGIGNLDYSTAAIEMYFNNDTFSYYEDNLRKSIICKSGAPYCFEQKFQDKKDGEAEIIKLFYSTKTGAWSAKRPKQ